jgi:hypothetical protein
MAGEGSPAHGTQHIEQGKMPVFLMGCSFINLGTCFVFASACLDAPCARFRSAEVPVVLASFADACVHLGRQSVECTQITLATVSCHENQANALTTQDFECCSAVGSASDS